MDGLADERKTALEALGIDLCYRQTRANHFGALVPWLAAVIFLAPVAAPEFWIWAVVLVVYVGGSFFLHVAYLRRPHGDGMRRWGRLLLAHNLFMGLLSGAFPLWVDVGLDPALAYLVILLVTGPWFGAAVLTAAHPPVFPVWIAVQPLILSAFIYREGMPWVVQALVWLAFLASMVLWHNSARLTRESAALRFDNLDLAQRARAAARAKARFLAAVGHDLRQPLNALGLFQGALAGELVDPGQRRLLARAEQARQELQSMLDSLAEQTRLEVGTVTVRRRAFSLCPFLTALMDEVRPLADSAGLKLRLRCREEEMVESDPHLLRRLLRNLVVNAVRHTPRGGVLVGVRRRGGRLRIGVWDTGPGIPPEDRERIFVEFVRLQRVGKGQGLGLSIVRQMAELLDHPLGLASREGRGSVFFVDLPRIEPAPGWVLLVDDDAEGREAMAVVLRQAGFEVVTLAERTPLPGHWPPPALVVSDYHLARGNGLDVVRALRRRYGGVPALLVSGDAEVVRDAGLPFLVKPVAAEALCAEVERLTAQ